jgi:sugar lactone lactonase YvrE
MRDHRNWIATGERRKCTKGLLLALACGLILALGGGEAKAATSFGKVGQFGEPGTEAGKLGESSPRGIAIDEAGGVWVTDGRNNRVQKFGSSPAGEFLLTFGWGVQNGASEFQMCTGLSGCERGISGPGDGQFRTDFFLGGSNGIAIAPTTADVYVADTANNRVEKFKPDGEYLSQFSGNEIPAPGSNFSVPTGLAVASITGFVYVMDSEHNVVDRFSAAGTYECAITGQATPLQCGAEGSETPQEGFSIAGGAERTANLAVDSSGDLYVADGGHGVVDEFNSTGAYLKQIAVSNPSAVAVDAAGDVFVSEGSKIVEFEASGTKVAEFGSPEMGEAVAIATTGSGPSERVYVADANNSTVWIFGPVVTPTCTTGTPPSILTTTGATVPGTINPEGIKATYYFEYGTSESYGSNTAEVSSWEGDEGTEPKEVNEALTGLQPHQTYDYELVASSIHGASLCGNQTLKTGSAKPSIEEQSASGVVTQTEATLQARINPNNEPTDWHFEYSTNPSLSGATSVPSPEGTIAEEFRGVPVSQPVSALQPNTTYYFRVITSDPGGGTSEGPIESFLTAPATPATGAASGINQTEATLTGTFTPDGHDTHYYFEYGACELPKTCAESSYPSKTAAVDGESGTNAVEPTAGLTGLQPLTTYHYRLLVTNASGNGGGPSSGPEREFTTLPLGPGVTTEPPVSVRSGSATLAGEVVPQCVEGRYPPTTYHFEYGTSPKYGSATEDATLQSASCAAGGEAVTVALRGLVSDTVYHYRLDAENGGGEGHGADHTFRTSATGGSTSVSLPPGFSLTGVAPAETPPPVFPNLTGLMPFPIPSAMPTRPPAAKAPSCEAKAKRMKNAKKRKTALKKCRKSRGRG